MGNNNCTCWKHDVKDTMEVRNNSKPRWQSLELLKT